MTVQKDSSEVSEADAFSRQEVSGTIYTKSNSSERNINDEVENRYFGHNESRRVRRLKKLVFLVLFLVTSAVCLASFFLTTKGQQAEF